MWLQVILHAGPGRVGVYVCFHVCVSECGTGNFPLVPTSLWLTNMSPFVGGQPPRTRPVYGPDIAPEPERVMDGKFHPVLFSLVDALLRPSSLNVHMSETEPEFTDFCDLLVKNTS